MSEWRCRPVLSVGRGAAWVAGILLPGISAGSARAQLTPRQLLGQAPPNAVAAAAHADPIALEREARAIVVRTADPRSFRVVTVAIPPELDTVRVVRYTVAPTGDGAILGSKAGVLDALTGASRAVVLTVGVPATATGGIARAAIVRFSADGHAAVRVPIELEVRGASRVEITPKRPLRGAQRGDRFELSFTIRNTGNVRDTIDLAIEAPAAWTARFTEAPRIVLQPGESVERTITVSIPTTADLGDFGVAIVATGRAGPLARGTTAVEVTDGLRPGVHDGPVVTFGVGSTVNAGAPARSVESIALQGALADGITIAGRISAPLPSDPIASRALTMLGYSPRSNFLSLTAPTWSATVGNSAMSLSPIAGESAFGRGASLRFGDAAGDMRLFAATPGVAGQMSWDQSSLIGATFEKKVGPSTLTAFLSHLRDSSYTVRALDAVGLGAELRPWADGIVSGQIAARSYGGGSGVGVAGVVQSPIAGGEVDLRVTHAPGGSSAFATATDALTVSANRAVGRLHAGVSYWATRDQALAADEFSSAGWSLSPAYPILPTLTLASYAQGSTFTSDGVGGRFSSTQRDLGVRGVFLRDGFELGADSRLSSVSRAVDAASQVVVNDDSRRVTNRVRLDHTGAHGEIGIGGSVETNIIGATSMPAQTTMDAHVDRLQFLPRLPHLTLSGSTQRIRFGDAALTTSRLEANLDVQRSTRIVLGVERGTARDAAGVMQTVFTLKIERAARLPALGRRSATGVVFEDRNGNGVRDPGEPGVSGIVVRRGSQSVITDADGVFRLDEAPGRAEVDARSLPRGWLPSPRPIGGGLDELSLGVVPTAALEVQVKLADGSNSARIVRVGRAALALRDTTGRLWSARTDESSHATFDALPMGRYTLTAELDESSEPLLVDPVAPIEITSANRRQRVTITVRTRPVRMLQVQP